MIRRVGMPQVICGFSVLTPHLFRLSNEPMRTPSERMPGAARSWKIKDTDNYHVSKSSSSHELRVL